MVLYEAYKVPVSKALNRVSKTWCVEGDGTSTRVQGSLCLLSKKVANKRVSTFRAGYGNVC
jgi:hypothetical protein